MICGYTHCRNLSFASKEYHNSETLFPRLNPGIKTPPLLNMTSPCEQFVCEFLQVTLGDLVACLDCSVALNYCQPGPSGKTLNLHTIFVQRL